MKRRAGLQDRGVSISRRAAALTVTLALSTVGASTAAQAQDPDDAAGVPPAAVPPAAPPSAPAVSDNGTIERLPATAYPEPYTRGLYGGSLWSTFHGLQWPFYPRTGIG